MTTAAAALGACVMAPVALSSTVSELPAVETEPVGEFSLVQLLREDSLGGDCIAEEDIDLAFFAAGKGMRLPRTCLPEPCKQALTPFRLAELIGRPAQTSEWDRYFSRYADACRKEVTSFDDETVATVPDTPEEFWAPILGARVVQGQLVRRPSIFNGAGNGFARRIGGGSGGGPGPSGPQTFTNFTPTDPPQPPGDDPDGPGGTPDGETPQIAPVPLPLSAWMLISGLLGLITLRKLRA